MKDAQKKKIKRLKEGAAKARKKGPRNSAGRVGSPNLRDAAKQVQARKKKIVNQVNSAFNK